VNQTRVLVAVGLAAFITALDNTVLTVALPTMQRGLDLGLTGLQWVGTSYILAFSSLLLVGGRLTDLLGRRKTLALGLAISNGEIPGSYWRFNLKSSTLITGQNRRI